MRAAATLVIAVVMLAFLSHQRAQAEPRIYDDFDDGIVSSALWEAHRVDASTAERGGELHLDIWQTYCDQTLPDIVNSEVLSNCTLQGDFDIQIGFRLIEWPTSSGVRLGLLVGPENAPWVGSVQRISLASIECTVGTCEVYTTHMSNVLTHSETGDWTGTLRVVRQVTTLRGYYLSGSHWELLGSGVCTMDAYRFGVAAWGHCAALKDEHIEVAIDNMLINSGTGCDAPIPVEPVTWGRVKALYR